MANAIFSCVNHVDLAGAVLSASNEAGDLKISNVADPIIGRRWRTTSLTAYGQVDVLTDKTFELLVLRFPRDTAFPTAGTVRHRLDADGGTPGAGAAHDSGAVAIGTIAGYGYHVYRPSSAVTARYWRWTFNVSGVSFIDVGRAWAGEAWQPSRNFAFGDADAWPDLSVISEAARSGAEFVDKRPNRRQLAFAIPFASGDRATAEDLQRVVGISEQLLFLRDPGGTLGREAILGRLAEATPILRQALPIHSKAFVIRESL